MNLNGETPTCLLLKHIRRALEKVVCDMSKFKAVESESKKQVCSLINLLDQRRSVLQVSFDWNISSLADVQYKLLVKISAEVDSKVSRLKEIILPLKDHHDCLNRSRTEILKFLKKHGADLDTTAMCMGSPLIPPIDVMLHWINELELQLRETYYSRFFYLEDIMDPEIVQRNDSATIWEQGVGLLAIIEDCEEQTRYFLENTG